MSGVIESTILNSVGSPLTTKGDVYGYSTANARIPVGANGQVLTADSAQTLGVKWSTPGSGTGNITDINTDATPSQTLTVGSTGTDFAIVDNGSGDHKFNLPSASATARGLVSTGGQTFAGIKTFSSLPVFSAATANTVPYLDAGKALASSAVTPTELGYVSGVTSAIQTQLGTKSPLASPTFTGTVTLPSGTISSSAWDTGTSTFTSNGIAFTSKAPLDSPVFTTQITASYATASTVPYLDASKHLVSSAVTPTTLGFLDATSSIQTQLNGKQSSFSGFTTDGVIYATSATAVASTAAGTAGQVLTSNGAGVAPTYQAVLTIGTTTITSGTDTRIPFNDGGTVADNSGLTFTKATGTLQATVFSIGTSGNHTFSLTGSNIQLKANGTNIMQFDSSEAGMLNGKHFINYTNGTSDIGVSGNAFRHLFLTSFENLADITTPATPAASTTSWYSKSQIPTYKNAAAAEKLIGADAVTIGQPVGSASANNVLYADGSSNLAGETTLAKSRGGTGADNSSVTFPSSGTIAVTFASSQVVCDTGNGNGSTNTVIRRYTNSTTTGSDITYADSATLGGTFTINTAGLYSISVTDFNNSSSNRSFGISLNSNQLTTSIDTITTANRLIETSTQNNQTTANCSTVARLAVNDVIRSHNDSGPGGATATVQFRIVRIG